MKVDYQNTFIFNFIFFSFLANLLGLVAHNEYRKIHSAPELYLDITSNQLAQKHAQYLASIQQFQHSGVPGYGENLYKFCSPNKILKSKS